MKAKATDDFREIDHCGGIITISKRTESDGSRSFSSGVSQSRPTPAAWFAIAVLPDSTPVATVNLFRPLDPRLSEAITVFIASDKRRCFGRSCPRCDGYWRTVAAPDRWQMTCPYCGARGGSHEFLTAGQKALVAKVCEHFNRAVNEFEDGEHHIDVDAVADEVAAGAERPKFYYAETTQQSRFDCRVCGAFNDILGKYGFCSCCGTRNNLALLADELDGLTSDLENGRAPEDALRDAVSKFDACGRDYVNALCDNAKLTDKQRKQARRSLRFHDMDRAAADLSDLFGIDLFGDLGDPDKNLVRLMYLRRHVYEHRGGVADDDYLERSGDKSLRKGQVIRESAARVRALLPLIARMAENLDRGFHRVVPTEEAAIAALRVRTERMRERRARAEAASAAPERPESANIARPQLKGV